MSTQSIVTQTTTKLFNDIYKAYTDASRKYLLLERFGVGRKYNRDRFRFLLNLERIALREDDYFLEKKDSINEKIRIILIGTKEVYQ